MTADMSAEIKGIDQEEPMGFSQERAGGRGDFVRIGLALAILLGAVNTAGAQQNGRAPGAGVLQGNDRDFAPFHIETLDPFGTGKAVPASAAKSYLDAVHGGADCALPSLVGEITLLQALEYALCHNPKTTSALAEVKARAARLGQSQSAYLPNISATLKDIRDRTRTDVPSLELLSSRNKFVYRDYGLSMTWKLLDFGGRSAQTEYARQLLVAAQDSEDDTIQSVLSTTVKDYYRAAAASAALDAARQTEVDAQDSLQGAKARFAAGVAAVVDQLQAQTQYAQAVLDRVKAAGDLTTALGSLALDMGLEPDSAMALPKVSSATQSDERDTAQLKESIDQMIHDVERSHPKSLAAQAQLQAALAKAEATRAEGLPSVNFNFRLDKNSQPVIPAVGLRALPAANHDKYVGIELDVPLFEGFDRSYKIREAQANIEAQRAQLFDVQQQVALNVWNSYSVLQTDTDNLANTKILLDSAEQAYVAAQQRYQKGAGSILELLSAQSALAAARQRRVQSLTDWRSARLQMAASLGRLSLMDLDGDQGFQK